MLEIIPRFAGYENSLEFVGLPNELTVDSDNHDLLIHDGVTPGGFRLPNYNNLVTLFQSANAELDGFEGFSASAKGLLIRIGVGQYRIGKIAVNTQGLTLQYANGQAGDPTISLKEIISSDHTFEGEIVFEQTIIADAGMVGDVQGNLLGNTQGDVFGNLQGNTDGIHTGSTIGNVDVRGATLELDDEQIPAGKVQGLAAALSALVPVGAIIMWAGPVALIPDGWKLCDGTNGTPDLSEKFILGQSDAFPVGSSGGTDTHAHGLAIGDSGAHTHPISVAGHALTEAEIPAHRHANGVVDNVDTLYNHGALAANPTTAGSIEGNGATGTREGYTTTVGGGNPHTHTATSDAAGLHTHTGAIGNSTFLPPYYALCFIMKG